MLDMQEVQVQFLWGEDPLEEETATHSSILAWKIPGMEEPGGLLKAHSQTRLCMHAGVSLKGRLSAGVKKIKLQLL